MSWLTRATLDVIGSAGELLLLLRAYLFLTFSKKGFGYEFNSLKDGDEDLLAKAFTKLFDSDLEITTYMVVKGLTLQMLGMVSPHLARGLRFNWSI